MQHLKLFAKTSFPDSKADLFSHVLSSAILRQQVSGGIIAMITMQSWMFLSSFEDLRKKLVANIQLTSMVHLGREHSIASAVRLCRPFEFVLSNRPSQSTQDDICSARRWLERGSQRSIAHRSLDKNNLTDGVSSSSKQFIRFPGSVRAIGLVCRSSEAFSKLLPLSEAISLERA